MRIEGVQFKKDDKDDELKSLRPQTTSRGEIKIHRGSKSKIDSRVKAKSARKEKSSKVTRSLAGLISLSKDLRSAKLLAQLKDDRRIKKAFGGLAIKFQRDFNTLRKKNSSILTARPLSELRIKRRRPRKLIERYYVSAGAPAGGDGTEGSPFKTISQALDRAAQLGHILIYVNIASGSYNENLEITRYTHLIGDGVVLHGSISSDQHLNLTGIHIRDAVGYGIQQSGKTLTIEGCSIMDTTNVDGAAIHLLNGADALLVNFYLMQNQGRALLLTGQGTKAEVRHIYVGQNTLDPQEVEQICDNYSRIGIVEVANGAKLMMEHFIVLDNDFIGILARDSGTAHVRFGVIMGTKRIEETGKIGVNVHAFENATIEMRNFSSQDTTAGIYVRNAYLTAIYGQVFSNELGFYYENLPDDYDWESCVTSQCTIQDNEQNIHGDVLAVPDTPMPIPGDPEPEPEPEPEELPCPRVDWEYEDGTPRRG